MAPRFFFPASSVGAITIDHLPNELLAEIVSNLDLASLLRCFNVSKRWREVCALFFVPSLESATLLLWFHQEGKRERYIEFTFKGYDAARERLIFERLRKNAHCRFLSSAMVQSPRLWAISFSPHSKTKDPADAKNHLDKHVPLRIGNLGNNSVDSEKHCFNDRYPWSFTYDVQPSIFSSLNSKRLDLRTARIFYPLTFECSPNFLDEERLCSNLMIRWFKSKFGQGGTLREWWHDRKCDGKPQVSATRA